MVDFLPSKQTIWVQASLFAFFLVILSMFFLDYPEFWQIGLQDPATFIAEQMILFHNFINFNIIYIGVAVCFLLGFIIYKFNNKKMKRKDVKQFTHSSVLEIIWTLIPALVLIILAIPSFKLLYILEEITNPEYTLKVIGHQWYWSYEYKVPIQNYKKLDDELFEITALYEYELLLLKPIIFDNLYMGNIWRSCDDSKSQEGIIKQVMILLTTDSTLNNQTRAANDIANGRRSVCVTCGVKNKEENINSSQDTCAITDNEKTNKDDNSELKVESNEENTIIEINKVKKGFKDFIEKQTKKDISELNSYGESALEIAFFECVLAAQSGLNIEKDVETKEQNEPQNITDICLPKETDNEANICISKETNDEVNICLPSIELINKNASNDIDNKEVIIPQWRVIKQLQEDHGTFSSKYFEFYDKSTITSIFHERDFEEDVRDASPKDLEFWNDFFNSKNEFYIKPKEVNREEFKRGLYLAITRDTEFISHYNKYSELLFTFLVNVEKELDFVTKEYFNIIFEGNINNIYTDYKIDSYMIPSDSLDYKSGDIRLLSVDNKVNLPVNKEIKVLITSADVLHSWAVPSFGIKVDACPGRLTQVPLTIKREGLFYGQCSEICGVNHGFMPITIQSSNCNI